MTAIFVAILRIISTLSPSWTLPLKYYLTMIFVEFLNIRIYGPFQSIYLVIILTHVNIGSVVAVSLGSKNNKEYFVLQDYPKGHSVD